MHPSQEKVLFASTHEDPEAEAKMKAELDERASGERRRYAWDYDETYDIYERSLDGGALRRLTSARGYDAEASWSPDGSHIVFASNRRAYEGTMSDAERSRFEVDPSSMIDLYRMRADGTQVERLTDHFGYDGGPFYSADGSKITWRRFDPDGKTAEIWVMNADGTNQRPITALSAMSWAPFFHPSGDYPIFTTNLHGYGNFELYLVRADGGPPVRVTDAEGFDGLPVFSPAGDEIAFTRGQGSGAQLVFASWDDRAARAALGLDPANGRPPRALPEGPLDERRIAADVAALTADEMEGRLTGTAGEARAAAYVARAFEAAGLEPAGTDGYFERFDFVAGVEIADGNRLEHQRDGSAEALTLGEAWRPLGFSRTATAAGPVAFAGYGIVAPEAERQPAYDAYGGLDVRGRWVVVLRHLPEDVSPERRQHLARHASARLKAMEARDRGAVGLVVVSGPEDSSPLMALRFDAAVGGNDILAVSMTATAAERLLERPLLPLSAALDRGEPVPGFLVEGSTLSARISLEKRRAQGTNVLGRLRRAKTATSAVLIGAHLDHLGRGEGGDSLARPEEEGQIHPGADDNASGVAGLLAIARWLSTEPMPGAERDIVFAAWSGEELGLYGSTHHVRALEAKGPLNDQVFAYLNMDMIGRLRDNVVIQGVASSPAWPRVLEAANLSARAPVRTSGETYLPTDATPFYMGGVPISSAFTGAHGDYHSPRDVAERIDVPGLARVAHLVGEVGAALAKRLEPLPHVKVAPPERSPGRRSGRAYLGTIPDYAGSSGGDAVGVPVSGAAKGSPAERAGVRAGDVLIELAGQPLANIYDFVRSLDRLKAGEPTLLVVLRQGQRVEISVTPERRD